MSCNGKFYSWRGTCCITKCLKSLWATMSLGFRQPFLNYDWSASTVHFSEYCQVAVVRAPAPRCRRNKRRLWGAFLPAECRQLSAAGSYRGGDIQVNLGAFHHTFIADHFYTSIAAICFIIKSWRVPIFKGYETDCAWTMRVENSCPLSDFDSVSFFKQQLLADMLIATTDTYCY